ncbi:hypothetical protein HFN51_04220 [Rhizobium leguminosarum]|nr:hypothetical protein [Rhizobium leguminosarum]
MTDEFVYSPEILVLAQQGLHRWTKHPRHGDYAVWHSNKIVAQGGPAMTERIYKERTA